MNNNSMNLSYSSYKTNGCVFKNGLYYSPSCKGKNTHELIEGVHFFTTFDAMMWMYPDPLSMGDDLLSKLKCIIDGKRTRKIKKQEEIIKKDEKKIVCKKSKKSSIKTIKKKKLSSTNQVRRKNENKNSKEKGTSTLAEEESEHDDGISVDMVAPLEDVFISKPSGKKEDTIIMEALQVIKLYASHMTSSTDSPMEHKTLATDFRNIFIRSLQQMIHGNLSWNATISRGTRSTKKMSLIIARSSFQIIIGICIL